MKEIIEKLIERGWDPKLTRRHSTYSGSILERMFSLADIINDNEAMRLLFGTHIETATRVWTGNLIDVVYDPHKKRKEEPRWVMETKDTPAYMTHQQQLIIMDTEEEQIAYIKEHSI